MRNIHLSGRHSALSTPSNDPKSWLYCPQSIAACAGAAHRRCPTTRCFPLALVRIIPLLLAMSTVIALGAKHFDSSDLTVKARVLSVEAARAAANILDEAVRVAQPGSAGLTESSATAQSPRIYGFEGEQPAAGGTVWCEFFDETPQQPALVQVEWTSN